MKVVSPTLKLSALPISATLITFDLFTLKTAISEYSSAPIKEASILFSFVNVTTIFLESLTT